MYLQNTVKFYSRLNSFIHIHYTKSKQRQAFQLAAVLVEEAGVEPALAHNPIITSSISVL